MGRIVSFKKPTVIRCDRCNKLKPQIQEKFSHRGIDTTGITPESWVVYQSGWKRVERITVKNGEQNEDTVGKVYFHCPECRSL